AGPLIERISDGEIEPSDNGIPALTKPFPCTKICLDTETKYFLICRYLASIELSRLPRFNPAKVATPSYSENTPGVDGLRASNNSVTRGRPPVISRVLPVARGILARIVPSLIFCLS